MKPKILILTALLALGAALTAQLLLNDPTAIGTTMSCRAALRLA